MKNYLNIDAIKNLDETIHQATQLKKDPYQYQKLGQGKTIGLLFFNNSLRTRLSMQKAAFHLGLNVMPMQFGQEGWRLEFEEGTIMNGSTVEHIKEAARIISQYCDMIGIRCFATLTDKQKDTSEHILRSFQRYANIPIVNMESATAHPLQGLADAMTIVEHQRKPIPKVVLSWVPHPKALPYAVANSFIKTMQKMKVDFTITHPRGYELDTTITKQTPVCYDQSAAFEGADFIYAKNWSSFKDYGKVLRKDSEWMITQEKMQETNNAKFMHCLPVRRNVVASDGVLDSENSLVIQQANNRTYAAQIVLKEILTYIKQN